VTFLSPARLWLLLSVAALGGAYVALQLRRRAYAVRFTNLALLGGIAPKRPGWRRHLSAAAFLLAVAALVLAFARPAWTVQVPTERATVVVAIDVSLSMEATDVVPSRVEAAKSAATTFVEELPPTLNVGLVGFAETAQVLVAPTNDRGVVTRAIQGLELATGTAIGEALFASLAAIESVPPAEDGAPVPARIVLMSDGETTAGRPNSEGAAAVLQAGVPVTTIAFGTANGTIVFEGEVHPVPVNGPALREIADRTGGEFFEALTGAELSAVYEGIGSSLRFEGEEREGTAVFTGIALVLAFTAAAGSLLWGARLP